MIQFDTASFINLAIYSLATWGLVAGLYFALKSDIRSLREEVSRLVSEKDEDHHRLQTQITDHETRLRVIEHDRGIRANG